MRRIYKNSDLQVGETYLCVSTMVYDNGKTSDYKGFLRCGEMLNKKFIGNNIWAEDDNNQALERYKIFGPIDPNKLLLECEKKYPEDFLD